MYSPGNAQPSMFVMYPLGVVQVDATETTAGYQLEMALHDAPGKSFSGASLENGMAQNCLTVVVASYQALDRGADHNPHPPPPPPNPSHPFPLLLRRPPACSIHK